MLAKKYLYLVIPVVVSLSVSASAAQKNPDMVKFYADERNKQALENAKRRGMVKKSREQIHSACQKQKDKSIDCKCMAKAVNKVPDDEFFYESILSYMEYQEKVKALKAKNQKLYDQLNKKYAKRTSLPKRLEKKCNK